MNISIGADHGGVELRSVLVEALCEWGHTVFDHGTKDKQSVDYPDYAKMVGEDVASGKAEFGILICKTGIGMSIAANKVGGIRAALVSSEEQAVLSRRHNDANVICFGAKYVTPASSKLLTKVFLKTSFEGGRHRRRLNKI